MAAGGRSSATVTAPLSKDHTRRATLPGIRIRHAAHPKNRTERRSSSVWDEACVREEGGCGSCGIMSAPVTAFIVSRRTIGCQAVEEEGREGR